MRIAIVILTLAGCLPLLPAVTFAQQKKAGHDRLVLDQSAIKKPCVHGEYIGDKPSSSLVVHVRAELSETPSNLEYRYTVTGGVLRGAGPEIDWHLAEAAPGTYQITMRPYVGGRPVGEALRETVTVSNAVCLTDCFCPTVGATGPDKAKDGDTIVFIAMNSGDTTYTWSVEDGEILHGQGTSEITVRVRRKESHKSVKATVTFSNAVLPACGCPMTGTASTQIID